VHLKEQAITNYTIQRRQHLQKALQTSLEKKRGKDKPPKGEARSQKEQAGVSNKKRIRA